LNFQNGHRFPPISESKLEILKPKLEKNTLNVRISVMDGILRSSTKLRHSSSGSFDETICNILFSENYVY
jgi:hypothetical protein